MQQKIKLAKFQATYRDDDDTGGWVVKFKAACPRDAIKHAMEKGKDFPKAGLETVQEFGKTGRVIGEYYFNTI